MLSTSEHAIAQPRLGPGINVRSLVKDLRRHMVLMYDCPIHQPDCGRQVVAANDHNRHLIHVRGRLRCRVF